MTTSSKLMAIVEVDKAERVYCAQPGCHHTVYKAIHVVKEGDQLLVLGSTCFQKRFGSLTALGKAQHWGGNGKVLTSEERALLAKNTQALLSSFESEELGSKFTSCGERPTACASALLALELSIRP